MKKIIIAMAAIAAAFTMASCNKEHPVSSDENPAVGKSVITASIDNDLTKATLNPVTNGYEVRWSEGDDIFVADYQFFCWAAKYTLDSSSAGSSTGVFSWHTGDMFIPATEEYEDGPVFEADNYYLAFYPFDLIGEDVAPIWKTEQTYDETERYIPMYSELEGMEGGTADFTFRNLGGMLRLTVTGSATISSIKISAAEGEAMSGPFSLMLDDNDITMAVMAGGANYIILDCGEEGVALTEDGTDFYFSIPCRCICGEHDTIVDVVGYSDVTITLTDMEGRTCVKKLKNEDGLVIERSKIATASFTANEFKANVPEGALPGKFTINEAGDQVYFSQGNLYYDESQYLDESEQRIVTVGFCFETNQYDYQVTRAPKHVSYFYWSTNPEHAAKGYDTTGSTSSGDVIFSNDTESMPKRNFTVNGVTGQFRTLSKDEWSYLFNNHSYKWVIVNGVKGYAIAPDGFDGTIADTYADNAALATDNLLFLPAAGGEIEGLDDRYIEENGFYWSSSSKSEKEAYGVWFHSSGVTTNYPEKRSSGYCVRLVKDC